MPYFDLRQYMEALEEAGELRRVAAAVDPDLEAGAVAQRVGNGCIVLGVPSVRERAEDCDGEKDVCAVQGDYA